MNREELLTAHLLFAREFADGAIGLRDLAHREVAEAATVGRIPSGPSRAYQGHLMRRGQISVAEHVVAPALAARRAVLHDAAPAAPRFLVRFDGFPNVLAVDRPKDHGTTAFLRVHQILAEHAVPYCVAVLPRVPTRALEPKATGDRAWNDAERDTLRRLRAEGVMLALQGLDHRTRDENPRKRSELVGLKRKELLERTDRGVAALAEETLTARVFVAPYNRLTADQYVTLSQRFEVVCGGPESVALMGFHPTPQVRGRAIWMPAYAPLAGSAREILPAARRIIDQQPGIFVPITLGLDAELADGFVALRELAALLGGGPAVLWDELLDAQAAARSAFP